MTLPDRDLPGEEFHVCTREVKAMTNIVDGVSMVGVLRVGIDKPSDNALLADFTVMWSINTPRSQKTF